jgi:hypothetical protein
MNFRRIPKRSDKNYIVQWNKYKELAAQLSTPAQRVVYGHSYCIGYNFSKEYDHEKLMFFDYFPLIYVIEADYTKDYFVGINLHHFPVGFREEWFRSIIAGRKVILPRYLENILPILKKPIPNQLRRMPYDNQVAILKWVKTGVRHYRYDRIKTVREIEPRNLNELLTVYSDTYFAATATQRVIHFYEDEYLK